MCNLYLFLIVFIVTFNASGSIKRNNYNNKNNGRRCRLLISKQKRNERDKKAKGLYWQNNNFARAARQGGGVWGHPGFHVTWGGGRCFKPNGFS